MDIDENATVYGYNVRELVSFAEACKREGITEGELHGFCTNFESVFKLANEIVFEQLSKTLREFGNFTGGD